MRTSIADKIIDLIKEAKKSCSHDVDAKVKLNQAMCMVKIESAPEDDLADLIEEIAYQVVQDKKLCDKMATLIDVDYNAFEMLQKYLKGRLDTCCPKCGGVTRYKIDAPDSTNMEEGRECVEDFCDWEEFGLK